MKSRPSHNQGRAGTTLINRLVGLAILLFALHEVEEWLTGFVIIDPWTQTLASALALPPEFVFWDHPARRVYLPDLGLRHPPNSHLAVLVDRGNHDF